MTLSASELAPLAASAKTEIDRVIGLTAPTVQQIIDQQAPGFDPTSVTYCTMQDLFRAIQAGYDLGIVTYDGLDTHLKVYVDNSVHLTADNLQRLRFLTIDSRIRAIVEEVPDYIGTGQLVIPDGCYKLKLTYQAAGGANGQSERDTSGTIYAGGSGGGGAAVFDYELSVAPASIFDVTVGDSLTIAPDGQAALLTVQAGTDGSSYIFANGQNGAKGLKGQVILNATPIDDGVTAIAGTDGIDGNEATAYVAGGEGATTNGKNSGAGGGRQQDYDGNSGSRYYGAGGGASPSFNGLDSIQPVFNAADTRVRPLGTGSPSAAAVDSNSSGYDVALASVDGGAASSLLEITYVYEPV